ncbi:MAG: hypothetical protein IBJ03_15300 [Gemmatimonadaceae bacterium]|nr:hypothetical protein [Gemmatimonadaceae bacterium]
MMRSLMLAAAFLGSAVVADAQSAPKTPARTVSGESAGVVGAAPVAAIKGSKAPSEITITRETYNYSSGGRRDPYKSLMTSSDVRPLLSDLRLVAVAFDPAGNNSVAILRDSFSKVQYRVRTGQQLGRLRVSAIRQKAVQFTMEEFGYNRQETLPLSSDTTKARNP